MAITGVTGLHAGDRICIQDGKRIAISGSDGVIHAALSAKVESTDGTNENTLAEKLRILEDEEPQLKLRFNPVTKETLVRVMGPIQLEVLQKILFSRFGICAKFLPPEVVYMRNDRGTGSRLWALRAAAPLCRGHSPSRTGRARQRNHV